MLVVVVGVAVAGAVLVTGFAPAPAYLAGGAAVVLSGMLVHRLAGLGLRQLSVPSVWYLSYVVVTAIPAFFVAAEEPSNYVTPYLFAVVVTLITAPLGMGPLRRWVRPYGGNDGASIVKSREHE